MNLFSFYFRKRRSGTNTCVRKKQEKVESLSEERVCVCDGYTDCVWVQYGVNDVVHSERCIAH